MGRCILLGHEVAHALVEDEGLVDGLEMVVAHGPGRRGEGKHVINRRGDLESPLVAMAHDAFDPFRIDHAGPHDAADLFLEAPDDRFFRSGMVVVVDFRASTRHVLDRRRHAAFELVVVVAVEQVVLAIVLILHHRLDRTQPLLEQTSFRLALLAGTIGVAAPDEIGFGEIRPVAPALLVDQGLEAGTIGARFRAEDTVAGPPCGLLLVEPFAFQLLDLGPHARRDRIVTLVLVEAGHGAHRLVEKRDLFRKGIAEEAGDAQCHVDARAPEDSHRNHFEPGHTAGGHVPERFDPDEGQALRDIIAAGAHVGCAPGRDAEGGRPFAVVLDITLDQKLGGFPAQFVSRRCRHGAAVDRVEVSSCGQDVRSPACRRAGGAGGHERASEAFQQALDFRGAGGHDGGLEAGFDFGEHSLGSRPIVRAGAGAGDQLCSK